MGTGRKCSRSSKDPSLTFTASWQPDSSPPPPSPQSHAIEAEHGPTWGCSKALRDVCRGGGGATTTALLCARHVLRPPTLSPQQALFYDPPLASFTWLLDLRPFGVCCRLSLQLTLIVPLKSRRVRRQGCRAKPDFSRLPPTLAAFPL